MTDGDTMAVKFVDEGKEYVISESKWQEMLIQAIADLTEEVRAQGELNRINNTMLARRLKGGE